MKVTIDLDKIDATMICEALRMYRENQREAQKDCADSNQSRFNSRINRSFCIESVLEEIDFKRA